MDRAGRLHRDVGVSPRWRPLHEDRGPRRVGESIEGVVPGGRTFTLLLRRWPELVGDGLAGHARPSALHATTLVVAVDDPAWATQLRYLEADLLARVREVVGADTVRELRVVVRPS